MLETFKSSGVRPGRLKVEVHIEQTEFSEKDKTLTLPSRFRTGWACTVNASQFTPSRFWARPISRLRR